MCVKHLGYGVQYMLAVVSFPGEKTEVGEVSNLSTVPYSIIIDLDLETRSSDSHYGLLSVLQAGFAEWNANCLNLKKVFNKLLIILSDHMAPHWLHCFLYVSFIFHQNNLWLSEQFYLYSLLYSMYWGYRWSILEIFLTSAFLKRRMCVCVNCVCILTVTSLQFWMRWLFSSHCFYHLFCKSFFCCSERITTKQQFLSLLFLLRCEVDNKVDPWATSVWHLVL